MESFIRKKGEKATVVTVANLQSVNDVKYGDIVQHQIQGRYPRICTYVVVTTSEKTSFQKISMYEQSIPTGITKYIEDPGDFYNIQGIKDDIKHVEIDNDAHVDVLNVYTSGRLVHPLTMIQWNTHNKQYSFELKVGGVLGSREMENILVGGSTIKSAKKS